MKDSSNNQSWGNFTQAALSTQACLQARGGCCSGPDIPPPPPPPGGNATTGG